MNWGRGIRCKHQYTLYAEFFSLICKMVPVAASVFWVVRRTGYDQWLGREPATLKVLSKYTRSPNNILFFNIVLL